MINLSYDSPVGVKSPHILANSFTVKIFPSIHIPTVITLGWFRMPMQGRENLRKNE